MLLSVFVMPSAGHAQVSITLDSCAPNLEKWDYTAKVVKCVETSVKAAVVQLMTQLSNFMTPIVAAMLTFSVAVYGMRMFTGQFEGVASTGAYVLRVWLIGIFYYNLGGFSQAIFDIEDWLVNLVVGTSPWTIIDGLLGKIVGAGPSMTDGVDATKGLLGILGAAAVSPAATSIVFFVGISALINFLLFIFRLVMTYLTAIVMIGFMIAISPLIIPMAMFKQQTEKYFNKWMNMFWQLLLVFPIVALLLGGGQLASAVVLKAGSSGANCSAPDIYKVENDQNTCVDYGSASSGQAQQKTSLSTGLAATGIAVAPLMAVWSVLQGALAAAGAMGAKIGSAIAKGVDQGSRATSKKLGTDTAFGRGLAMRKARKQQFKDKKFADKMGGKGFTGGWSRIAARGVGGSAIARNLPLPGRAMRRDQHAGLTAQFAAAGQKIKKQEQEEAAALLDKKMDGVLGKYTVDSLGQVEADGDVGMLGKELMDAYKKGDNAKIKAASDMLAKMGEAGAKALRTTMTQIDQNKPKETKGQAEARSHMQGSLLGNHASLKATDSDINEWTKGGRTMDEIHTNSDGKGNALAGLEDAKKATQRAGALKAYSDTSKREAYGGGVATRVFDLEAAKDISASAREEMTRFV